MVLLCDEPLLLLHDFILPPKCARRACYRECALEGGWAQSYRARVQRRWHGQAKRRHAVRPRRRGPRGENEKCQNKAVYQHLFTQNRVPKLQMRIRRLRTLGFPSRRDACVPLFGRLDIWTFGRFQHRSLAAGGMAKRSAAMLSVFAMKVIIYEPMEITTQCRIGRSRFRWRGGCGHGPQAVAGSSARCAVGWWPCL